MSPHHAQELLTRCRTKRLLVVGDVMLDRFLWGGVSRISPEAPVPVVDVERESMYPGGAANVARNLVPFAGEVRMAGIVGDDDDGRTLLGLLSEGGIDGNGIQRQEGYMTIAKTRIIARQQQVVRIDRERVVPASAGQVGRVVDYLKAHADELDGLVIEDYGKGLITQALADAVIPVARAAGLIVTVDPNPNNPLEWRDVTAVKPNRSEAFREAGVQDNHRDRPDDPLEDEALQEVGRRLLARWDTELLQITLGEQGMVLFERDARPHHIPTRARTVFDVSGAGDTAIALFTLALTAGAPPREAAEIANYASGVVVGKLGTATLEPSELLAAIRDDATEKLTGMPDRPTNVGSPAAPVAGSSFR